ILQASSPAISDTLCDSSQAQRLQNQSVYAEGVCRFSLHRSFLSLCYRRSIETMERVGLATYLRPPRVPSVHGPDRNSCKRIPITDPPHTHGVGGSASHACPAVHTMSTAFLLVGCPPPSVTRGPLPGVGGTLPPLGWFLPAAGPLLPAAGRTLPAVVRPLLEPR